MRYRHALYLMIISHKDHGKALKDILKAGLDVYTSQGTWDATGVKLTHRSWIIRAKHQFHIGTWTILPFETEHDVAEPLGFLLANTAGDKLLFATDTYYLRYQFPGLTHIMVECNYDIDILQANVDAGRVPVDLKNRIIKSHFSLANVKEFFRANDLSRVQEIHLIHLSGDNSDAGRFKREIMALTGKPVYIAG